MKTTAPKVGWALPYSMDEAMRRIVPTKISAKPNINSFNGNVAKGISALR